MATIGNLVVNLKAKTASFDRALKSGKVKLWAFRKSLSSVGKLASFGLRKAFHVLGNVIKSVLHTIVRLAKATAIAFLGVTTYITLLGARFEKSMSRVKALTNATEKDFNKLQETARQLGETTEFTASQAASAMGYLALAGFKTQKIIEAMPHVLDLASAGQIELATAADITAKIMAGMGIESKDLSGAVDILAKAFTTANTDLEQLGEALKYVGPVGRTAGKGLGEIVSVIQVLSNVGIQGSMAGTSVRGIISRLAGSTPAVSRAMEKLGIKVKTAAGKMRPLAGIIDDINKKMGHLQQADKMAKIMSMFGLRAGPAMAALLDEGGDAIRRYEGLLDGAGGTAKRIATTQLDNLYGSFIKLKSAIEGVAERIGSHLTPKIRYALEEIRAWLGDNKDQIAAWADVVYDKIGLVIARFAEWVTFIKTDWRSGLRSGFNWLVSWLKTVAKISVAVLSYTVEEMLEIVADKTGYKRGLGDIRNRLVQTEEFKGKDPLSKPVTEKAKGIWDQETKQRGEQRYNLMMERIAKALEQQNKELAEINNNTKSTVGAY